MMMILPTLFIFTGTPLFSARINVNFFFFSFIIVLNDDLKVCIQEKKAPLVDIFEVPLIWLHIVSLNESLLVWPWDLCSGASSAGVAWSITNQKRGEHDRNMQLKLYWLFSIGNMCWYWWKFCTHIDWFVMLWDLLTKARLGIHPKSLSRRRIWDG